MLVVAAVHRDPASRRVLHTARADDAENVLHPARDHEAAMGQQPMEVEVDAKAAEYIRTQHDTTTPVQLNSQLDPRRVLAIRSFVRASVPSPGPRLKLGQRERT